MPNEPLSEVRRAMRELASFQFYKCTAEAPHKQDGAPGPCEACAATLLLQERAQRLTPAAAAAVEAWRSLREVSRDMWLDALVDENDGHDAGDFIPKLAANLLRAFAAPPAETPAAEPFEDAIARQREEAWQAAGAAGLIVGPEQPPCACRRIQAEDPRRHFQGCPLRKPLDAEPPPPAPAPKPRAWPTLPVNAEHERVVDEMVNERVQGTAVKRPLDPKPREAAMCSVCTGSGKPLSGLPCICGGSGLERDEIAHLRGEVLRTAAIVTAARRVAEQFAKGDKAMAMPSPLWQALNELRSAVDSSAEPQDLTREEG